MKSERRAARRKGKESSGVSKGEKEQPGEKEIRGGEGKVSVEKKIAREGGRGRVR